MNRSPDSQIPSAAGQPAAEKRDDKAFDCRQEGEANLRAATQVNVVSASSTPPAITPIQLELFPGRACPLKAKPATVRSTARNTPDRRDGVEDGGTQRKHIRFTGETLFGPAEETSTGREAYKGQTRKRGNEAGQGVGGGHSTDETRENRVEGRAATFIKRTKQGKASGLPPQGKAQPRTRQARRKAPARLDNARNIRQRIREVTRSFPWNGQVGQVIQKLNPVLNGWCTYFRVGNSNRTFHKVDWAVRSELQLWLRRKHQCPWRTAKRRWGYRFLHDRCRLYRMVGKVSHLEGLRAHATG